MEKPLRRVGSRIWRRTGRIDPAEREDEGRQTTARGVGRREAPGGKGGGGLSDPRLLGRQPPKAPIWEVAAFFSTAASAGAS
jgi:hypothetical protein